MIYMEKFSNDPITKKLIRGLIVSTNDINREKIGISEKQEVEERRKFLKSRLMVEMEKDKEYLSTVMDAAFEILTERVVGEINWNEPIKLTPDEEIGRAIAKMLLGDYLK